MLTCVVSPQMMDKNTSSCQSDLKSVVEYVILFVSPQESDHIEILGTFFVKLVII